MGTAERKVREKEELRGLILNGAKKLFLEKGIEQTNIRNIAQEIEYSTGTVYVYFKDKKDILHALHSEGFTELGGRFKVLYNVSEPMERLRAMGRVYIQFAIENKDMYDLMFTIKAPMDFLLEHNDADWSEGKATFGALKSTVEQCMERGHFKGHDLEPLTFMIWSVVHGMCSLEINNRCHGVNLKDPTTIVEKAFEEFIKIINKL